MKPATLGRPRTNQEPLFPTQINLTDRDRRLLAAYGGGSIVAGIRRLVQDHLAIVRVKEAPPRKR